MADIICDFDGVLRKNADHGDVWKYVAKQAIKPKEMFKHPLRTASFALGAKPELERLYVAYERGETGYEPIYEAFNRLVLSRMPSDFVIRTIDEYARLPETQAQLNMDVLGPVSEASGVKGIVSTGSKIFINDILRNINGITFYPVVANPILDANGGKGSEFILGIQSSIKPYCIENYFFAGLWGVEYDRKRTVYIGDNKNEEPAFECIAGSGGRIVVPHSANPEFKEYATKTASYRDRVFVPESAEDLRKFLRSL